MKKLILIASAIIFFAACATTEQSAHIKDGKEYGVTEGTFRHRWWNYYERGGSFSEGEFYKEAIGDFKESIKQRKDDRWKARTYGMHFVNYFPHRELGVVYYRLNKYEEAVQELEASLNTAESAKAKYFLNRARKALLERTGVDRLPPSLEIVLPPSVTRDLSLNLSGIAEDDYFVSSVTVNGTPLFLELSAERFSFETEVVLNEGLNEIRVEALDLTGKAVQQVLKVTVDRRGPIITITEQQRVNGKVKISGFVSDDTGVGYLAINGKEVVSGALKEAAFEHSIELGKEDIVLEAKDSVGNLTRAELRITAEASVFSRWPILASAGKLFALGIGDFIDRNPPVIKLRDMAETQEVYDDAILIEGEVSDESTIKSLKINNEEILKRNGKRVYFSHLAGLEKGVNSFTIEAVDTLRNKGTKTVSVTRKVQKVRQLGSRMSIALLPMERKGEKSVAGDAVYDSLISAFVNQGRFNIVERQKMEAVLRELKLSQTELVDPKTAARAGKIAAADGIMTVTVFETKDSIEVIARLIDTETSSVMSSNDAFDEQKGLIAVNKLSEALAYKFRRDFPLLEGLIIETKGSEVLIDIGLEKRLRRDMKLILFREGPAIKHPVTGRVLGSKTRELGLARVKDVHEEFSSAEIIENRKLKTKNRASPRVMDRVITK